MAKQRGRKTAGTLNAVTAARRPDPPSHLTKAQKETWKRIVNALPVGWFRGETLDLLDEYCQQVMLSRRVDKLINHLPVDAPINEFARLIRMSEKTTRMMISLATKMRLTQQASYDKKKSKDCASPASDPWLTMV